MTIQETPITFASEQSVQNEVRPTDIREKPEYAVRESVAQEVDGLIAQGYDVAFVDPADEHRLGAEDQEQIDQIATYLEDAEDGAELFLSPPAMGKWSPLTKRAIALHPLYGASTARTLGDGIGVNAYDRPVFPILEGGDTTILSAKELLFREKSPEKAQKILNSYLEFVDAPIDDVSRLFYRGSKDAAGVRTRATAAMDMAQNYISSSPGLRDRKDLVSASLACGAAGPVYDLVKNSRHYGNDFSKVILVDKDEMALASASALATAAGVEDVVDIQRRDLLSEDLTDYIEPHSVDVVDLLGLFEYLPEDFGVLLLQKVKEIVRPGGIIVFGNMLQDRPQQRLFSDVAKWPPLEQRTVSGVFSIIQKAGFDLDQVITRIPAREGVYAVYAIKTAPESFSEGVNKADQLAA